MFHTLINLCNHETKKTTVKYTNSISFSNWICLLIVLIAIIFSSCIIINWIKNVHYLSLSYFVVTGDCYYTTNDDIRQIILALESSGTFFTQNINIIQQQIKRMPWIKQASVRKQWPDKLKIHLVEYIPIARWNDLYVLDSNCKVFSVPTERIKNQALPMLYGPEGSEQDVLSGYYIMNKVLMLAKFQLKALSMNVCRSWQLTLQNNIQLKLGRDNISLRLQRFIKIYPLLLQNAQDNNRYINYVDLRYDSGLAVGWIPTYIELENSDLNKIRYRQNNNDQGDRQKTSGWIRDRYG